MFFSKNHSRRRNLLYKYSSVIENIDELSEETKKFASILTQAALFSSEGITKKELGMILNISPSTVDKRLAKLREMGMLLEENCKPAKYLINLNVLS